MGTEGLIKQINQRIVILLAFLVLLITFVIGAYVVRFHNHALSATPVEWGPFGDYIGGLLNPIFSFFAFIALLMTLRQTQETNAKQWEYLEKIERKREWLNLVEHTEKQIQQMLSLPVIGKDNKVYDMGVVLIQVGKEVHESGKSGDKEYSSTIFAKNYKNINPQHFVPLQSLFEALATHVEHYASSVIDGEKKEIVGHYVSSYIGYVAALQRIGLMKGISGKRWNNLEFGRNVTESP